MMGKTYLSLIQYRRSESGSNKLDADMPNGKDINSNINLVLLVYIS